MANDTKILTEYPATLWECFHDDPIVAKYRRLLGRLVYQVLTASKRNRPAILARKEQVQRQIKGRQIQLLKSGLTPDLKERVPCPAEELTPVEPEVWVPMTFTSGHFLTSKRNRV